MRSCSAYLGHANDSVADHGVRPSEGVFGLFLREAAGRPIS